MNFIPIELRKKKDNTHSIRQSQSLCFVRAISEYFNAILHKRIRLRIHCLNSGLSPLFAFGGPITIKLPRNRLAVLEFIEDNSNELRLPGAGDSKIIELHY